MNHIKIWKHNEAPLALRSLLKDSQWVAVIPKTIDYMTTIVENPDTIERLPNGDKVLGWK